MSRPRIPIVVKQVVQPLSLPGAPWVDAVRRRMLKAAALSPIAFSPAQAWAAAAQRHSLGYGKDPPLNVPAAPWPRLLSRDQRSLLTSLADALLPTDAAGPGAVAVGVVDFLDEWLSAQYPTQQDDRALLLPQIAKWEQALPKVSGTTGQPMPAWPGPPQSTDLSSGAAAEPDGTDPQTGAALRRLRELIIIGWGTTPEAALQLGFVGNEARARFDGPPAEVLELLRTEAARRGPR